MQKYPSMTSVHSMMSMGYLPPGHGYVPKKVKPDKPYGPSFISVMNRTWRGPGRKYIKYAIVTFCIFILFICASGLYLGHRNVSRMIVLRTEVFGAMFVIISILLFGLMIHFIVRARQESNKWRASVRFRAEGMYVAAAYNPVYNPEDGMRLYTGTYGRKALRVIPKQKKGPKGRSRAASKSSMATATQGNLQRGIYEKKAAEGAYGPPGGPPEGMGYNQGGGNGAGAYAPYPSAPGGPPPGQEPMYAKVHKEPRGHVNMASTGESEL